MACTCTVCPVLVPLRPSFHSPRGFQFPFSKISPERPSRAATVRAAVVRRGDAGEGGETQTSHQNNTTQQTNQQRDDDHRYGFTVPDIRWSWVVVPRPENTHRDDRSGLGGGGIQRMKGAGCISNTRWI